MSNHRQILTEIKKYVGQSREFDFMNIYKGVPLVYKGILQEIQGEKAVFELQSPDSICLSWSAETHILDNSLFSGIKANVAAFDINTSLVTLDNFNYSERGFGERALVRVEPAEPIPVELRWDDQYIDAGIVDLSLTGFGIHLDQASEQIPAKGTRIHLKFKILNSEIEMPAKVMAIFEAQGGQRVATYFDDTSTGYSTIAQYITRRRVDLRKEIQEKHDHAMKAIA